MHNKHVEQVVFFHPFSFICTHYIPHYLSLNLNCWNFLLSLLLCFCDWIQIPRILIKTSPAFPLVRGAPRLAANSSRTILWLIEVTSCVLLYTASWLLIQLGESRKKSAAPQMSRCLTASSSAEKAKQKPHGTFYFHFPHSLWSCSGKCFFFRF